MTAHSPTGRRTDLGARVTPEARRGLEARAAAAGVTLYRYVSEMLERAGTVSEPHALAESLKLAVPPDNSCQRFVRANAPDLAADLVAHGVSLG